MIKFITFKDKGKPYNYGFYITCNEEEIKLLESHPFFNIKYQLAIDEEEQSDHKEDFLEKVYDKVYQEAEKTQDAVIILNEQYGIPKSKLRTRAEVTAQAERLNISFPNLK